MDGSGCVIYLQRIDSQPTVPKIRYSSGAATPLGRRIAQLVKSASLIRTRSEVRIFVPRLDLAALWARIGIDWQFREATKPLPTVASSFLILCSAHFCCARARWVVR